MKKEALFAQVQQLHEEGYSIRVIARETGISKSSVGRMVKEIQDSRSGKTAGTCPMPVLESPRIQAGTATEAVPETDWDAHGTLESNENVAAAQAVPPIEHENHAFAVLMRMQRKSFLQSSYQDFLYNTRTFLTKELSNEELAHSLIESRYQRLREFIDRALRDCSECQVEYWELFMSYVLEELNSFLGQQPELDKTERGLKIKAGTMIEKFIKQVERLDIFTPIADDLPYFLDTEAL